MKNCIFCEEELDEGCLECPNCSKKPFSGMYLNDEIFFKVVKLEENGELEKAWDLLYEEWKSHTDHEYYDEEVVGKISKLLNELYEKNNQLIDKKVIMSMDLMTISAYWDGYDSSIAENILEIVRGKNRIDLEIKILECHSGLQLQRYGVNREKKNDLNNHIKALKIKLEYINRD